MSPDNGLAEPKRALLFLCHRIPFPPDKGEKIRAFRILEHLAPRFRISLGFFVDDPADMAHIPALQPYCAEVRQVPLSPRTAKLRALGGLLTGQALTVSSFSNVAMGTWVSDVLLRERPEIVFLYSSTMAQFVMGRNLGSARLLMDFVDVDSDKFRQYARVAKPPMKWVYAREAERLLDFDRQVAAKADASLFVSDAEAGFFKTLIPEAAGPKVHAISNGIDCIYFSPMHVFPSPFLGAGPHLVFTGTMDYRPNVDAVCWFAADIFPKIQSLRPAATFTVVGAKPSREVEQLAGQPGIRVTGRVPDVRPYLAHANAIVAPLRISRGIQNKILEGMAMAKPVVTTSQGLEGIDATPGKNVLVADTVDAFVAAVEQAVRPEAENIGKAARRLMQDSYTWKGRLALLDQLVA